MVLVLLILSLRFLVLEDMGARCVLCSPRLFFCMPLLPPLPPPRRTPLTQFLDATIVVSHYRNTRKRRKHTHTQCMPRRYETSAETTAKYVYTDIILNCIVYITYMLD